MMAFDHTSLGVGIALLPRRDRRVVFFFGLIREVHEYLETSWLEGLARRLDEISEEQEVLRKHTLRISSKCPIYTSLEGLTIERSPWYSKRRILWFGDFLDPWDSLYWFD